MLTRHGIAVSVIPGITSASAMASRLGLSLTHRDHAQSVRFVTGHARSGALPENLDWRGLADPHTTLVFYMGGNTAHQISDRLMSAGLSPLTPAHIVTGVTNVQESHWSGCVRDLAIGAKQVRSHLPLLIGIGFVFGKQDGACGVADSADVSANQPAA
jgi:uroporphyrin-III C-methyltransferase / precorrin-2 dehydrogenase / sirohydrochlorin ferrochelatase